MVALVVIDESAADVFVGMLTDPFHCTVLRQFHVDRGEKRFEAQRSIDLDVARGQRHDPGYCSRNNDRRPDVHARRVAA